MWAQGLKDLNHCPLPSQYRNRELDQKRNSRDSTRCWRCWHSRSRISPFWYMPASPLPAQLLFLMYVKRHCMKARHPEGGRDEALMPGLLHLPCRGSRCSTEGDLLSSHPSPHMPQTLPVVRLTLFPGSWPAFCIREKWENQTTQTVLSHEVWNSFWETYHVSSKNCVKRKVVTDVGRSGLGWGGSPGTLEHVQLWAERKAEAHQGCLLTFGRWCGEDVLSHF